MSDVGCCPTCRQAVATSTLLMDPDKLLVSRFGRLTSLRPREFKILQLLRDANGSVVTAGEMFDAIHAGRAFRPADAKLIQVYVCKLRKALTDFGLLIESRWGLGYWLELVDQVEVAAARRDRRHAGARLRRRLLSGDVPRILQLVELGHPRPDIANRLGVTLRVVDEAITGIAAHDERRAVA